MMLEQEFEKLLAAYFEDELKEAGLIALRQGIDDHPSYRRRFQRELRLHSLMREAALVRVEEGTDVSGESSKVVSFRRSTWARLATVAAVILLCGFLTKLAWNHWGGPEKVGYCLHVSESDGSILWRDGKGLVISKDTVIRAGDRIETGNQGQASFEIKGVGILTLKSQTEVQVFPPNDKVSVSVEDGMVLVEAEKREPGTPPALFRTPKAEVEVMGTVFGLEVNAAATRVKVHEGLVRFSNRSSARSVEVEAGQYGDNGVEEPTVFDQSELRAGSLLPGQLRLLPSDDVCSDGQRFLNDEFLKVEKNRRTSYLKFEVPEGGLILGAKLRLTQSVDAGSGQLKVFEGSHHEWSEESMSRKTAPKHLRELDQLNGWVGLDQVVELDVSSLVTHDGTFTLMVTLEKGGSNDIWFGSKESSVPPELILTRHIK
ncbi:FecR domain-containing protein [Verrucomicrobiaceae bacterium 227]